VHRRSRVRPVLLPGWILTCGLCAVAACGNGSAVAPVAEQTDAGDVGEAATCPADAAAVAPVACSDGAVAALVAAEEQADVDLAMAVREQLVSAGAIAFAEKEITDHTLLLLSLQSAARDDGVALIPNDDAAAVTQSTKDAIQQLKSLLPGSALGQGGEVDRGYMARAVLGHATDRALLDGLVSGSVRDPRIAAALAQHRALVAGHEALALEVQRELAGACGVAPRTTPRR
jgi:hypothetical protein